MIRNHLRNLNCRENEFNKETYYLQIKEFKLINAKLLLGLFQLNDKQPPRSQNPTILV